MNTVTTRTLATALLAAAVAIPSSAFADVMYRAKSGALVCPGNTSENNFYSFVNNNTKSVVRIRTIEVSDKNGKVVKTWTAGKKMPKGLPKSGVLKARNVRSVVASDLVKNINSKNKPSRVRITWQGPKKRTVTKPSVSLTRNFMFDSFTTVSQRTSNCSPINPKD